MIESLEHFTKAIETNSILEKDEIEDHASHLFYYIIERMYGHMQNDINAVNEELTAAQRRQYICRQGDGCSRIQSFKGIA